MQGTEPFIEIKNLCKSFGANWVIQDLSLSIDEGEIIILQGPSGIGKSTLLKCLTHLEGFGQGSIRVGSFELTGQMNERKNHKTILAVRQQLGFVFQSFNLFPHLTVLENITIGPIRVLKQPQEAARREALELLRRVKLEHKANDYPSSLSGGQQQRVSITRALALHPKGILFDEPTSSLDPSIKREIIDVIEDFAQDGLTMLIVTHELPFFRRIATRFVKFGPQCKVVSDTKKKNGVIADELPTLFALS